MHRWQQFTSRSWAKVLRRVTDARVEWDPVDLSQLWLEELRNPTSFPENSSPVSLENLQESNQPSIESLEAVKRFAKLNLDHPEACIPQPVARGLYVLSVVTARLRCRKVISRWTVAELRGELAWLEGEAWLDSKTRTLLLSVKERHLLESVEVSGSPDTASTGESD